MSELTREDEDGLRWWAGQMLYEYPHHEPARRAVAALDELAALRQRVADLTAGLRPFAEYAQHVADTCRDSIEIGPRASSPTIGDCRAAARLLAEGPETTPAPTHKLLADYTELMNKFGVDSATANAWITLHKDNAEFVELAQTARQLKIALTSRKGNAEDRP